MRAQNIRERIPTLSVASNDYPFSGKFVGQRRQYWIVGICRPCRAFAVTPEITCAVRA